MNSMRRLFLIIALTCMWSPSFLFIKLALEDLPPFTIVTLRVGIASLVFGAILLLKRRVLPTDYRFWVSAAVMATFSSVLPFVLFCFAEQSIESALAAILNGCSPMFTALLAHLFISSDRLSPQKIVGIFLSTAGLLLMFAPNIEQGLSGTALGILAATTAAFCYGCSHVYGKMYQTGYKPFVVPTAQLFCSTLMLLPVALYYDAPLSLSMPSSRAILGVCGLILFGTILAFIIYYKLLEHCGPTAISMVACFFPVVGMLLGFVFLGESLSWWGVGASSLIFLGLVIVTEVIDLKAFFARRIPAQNS